MELTGAQALIKSLEMAGVDVMFGIPGGATLPAYDPLLDSTIRHILVRHEQGAGHMAEGYAHVTGRPGVVMVTSGPGATNLVTPLCDANVDSVPLVAITGQVATGSIGSDAFQESDTIGITRSVTKHNELLMSAQDIPRAIAEAFHIATTGRQGPVLVDVPKDVLIQKMTWYWPDGLDLPGYQPVTAPDPKLIRRAAEMILAATRPVLYVGGGIQKARAAAEMVELAEFCEIPVVTTLMGRGLISDDHRLALGMPGMHGNYTAVTALQNADLLVTIGARFDDRVTGKVALFAPDAKVIHADVDPAEHGKVRRPDVAIIGDAKEVIIALMQALRELLANGHTPADTSAWRQTVSGWQEKFPLTYDQAEPGQALKPQMVMEKLRDSTPDDTILVSGVGQHQMWASQFWKFRHPYAWVNSGGLGTMGFSVPAAIGAKLGQPDRMVWAVDGDGSFQMMNQELTTAALERIPVKVAILNNEWLGMVRQWQELFYDERYSGTSLSSWRIPDFVKMAEAMGCVGIRCEEPGEVDAAIEKANSINDRPVVVDFRTEAKELVYPMVPAGNSNDDILVHPSQSDALAAERERRIANRSW